MLLDSHIHSLTVGVFSRAFDALRRESAAGNRNAGTAAPAAVEHPKRIGRISPAKVTEPFAGGSEFNNNANIINQRVVHSEARADSAFAERIPRQGDSRPNKFFALFFVNTDFPIRSVNSTPLTSVMCKFEPGQTSRCNS